MPFKDPLESFRHILNSIVNIHTFRATLTLEQVREDRMREAAIERELQIISEAANRLGDQAETLCPTGNWRDIRGFSNRLRHAYDRLDAAILQDILDRDLPALELEVRAALARLRGTP